MPTASSGDLVIKNFKVGVGPSPHEGFGDMRNMDISSRPGIARPNYATVKVSGTAIADVPVKIICNPRDLTEFFALGADGILYVSNDSGATWAALAGAPTGGISIETWEDFLFLTKSTTLNVFGPLTNGPTASWQTSWQPLSVGTEEKYPMMRSINDGKLYGGHKNNIFSLEKAATGTFSPTGGATSYTFTSIALDLPGNADNIYTYRIKCLSELGANLMIGTSIISTSTDREIENGGVVFPWDRSSVSYGTPMVLQENGISQMITIDNVLYIKAGSDGRWYKSNGVQYVEVVNLPSTIVNLDGGRFLDQIGDAIASSDGKLYFGTNPGATGTDLGGMGVWSLNLKTGVLNFEHAISTGNMGDASCVRIGSILPYSHDRLMIGWKDGATAGIDITGTGRYDAYEAYIDSPMYLVGTPLVPRQFTQLEFQLVEPLATGQGVKISYRTNLSDAFTVIGTYDFATLGAVQSHNTVATIPDCEFVQLRIALTCAGTNASPQLRTVTLR